MLNIRQSAENGDATFALEGRLDTVTAPQLEKELVNSLNGFSSLTFDLEKLEFLSSAGLRILLSAQKQMNERGPMRVCNVAPAIMEIFEVTGFTDILTIE